MTINFRAKIYAILICLMIFSCKEADKADIPKLIKITIDATKPLFGIQPTMYGIFFEDINSGADGGLYAELIKNRSFEFEYPWMGWKHLPKEETLFNTINELTITNNSKHSENNLKYVRIDKRDTTADFGLQNEGFDGIGLKENNIYDLSCWARSNAGAIRILAELADTAGHVLGSVEIIPSDTNWKKYEAKIMSNTSIQNARLNIYFQGTGQLDVDHISLCPQDTWKERKGGLRKDLVELLADLKPGFVRFPGGCIVEGRTLAERYQWKKTIGAVEERKVLINRWNMEFKHRPSPDYFQSFGLGFYEYFLLSEDLGAEPVPILSCGLACQFNSSESVLMEDLDPYVQDALDLIEFANGAPNTKWGKIRAEMGHPSPFHLKFIGVGNEQWGQEYFERYEVFAKAIKSKFPAINIISGTGPFAEGELFEYAEKELTRLKPEIVDEHYYKSPQWFLENAGRYDAYDRSRYKIFAGEYAAQSVATVSPENKNNWECALAEAAFMTGLERNADVVYMSSYAPLLAHVKRWQWTPDLIWFDNLTSFGTANYYVQKMFSNHKGTHIVPILSEQRVLSGQHGLYASSSVDTNSRDLIIKLVNVLTEKLKVEFQIKGYSGSRSLNITSMQKSDLKAYNTIDHPHVIVPTTRELKQDLDPLLITLDPSSFTVIRIPKN